MKKCLATLLALLVLLSGTGVLAEIVVDTAQLNGAFDISYDDFKASVDFWRENLSETNWTGWGDPIDLGDGFTANRYDVENSIEVVTVGKDGMLSAILMDLAFDLSGSGLADSYSSGVLAGNEFGLLISAVETPGITTENMMQYTDFIAMIQDGSFSEAVQGAFSSLLGSDLGEGTIASSAPLLDDTFSFRAGIDGLGIRYSLAYAPGEYAF